MHGLSRSELGGVGGEDVVEVEDFEHGFLFVLEDGIDSRGLVWELGLGVLVYGLLHEGLEQFVWVS